eukprot:CAMPEP_0175891146 /NCGR_PEP_ID=MMETSP0107_2-20121207/48228_1 /TAXON_ID=195067 ORGANISM="Goniomonas pacifica, Strain CCMP1869" /NCGR_SAMPLE_ID=MMETSP0107_2 /ASSEMBLY_ACC=CAM_ASM_000203 /LENGTH=48 /DNA_ID= /DNA_START= /DNA_END= /DNA_ORIENTATION=
MSTTFTVLSSDADARSLPSPLNATDVTQPPCPCSVDTSAHVSVDHTLT